jgi:hypothetical protein
MVMNMKRFFLSGLIGLACYLSADAEEKTNPVEPKSNADMKKFLKLPYDANFTNARKDILGDFKTILDDTIGVGNFALISLTEESNPSRLSLEFCSADLARYNVSVTMPESLQAACDKIFFSKVLTSSSNQAVVKNLVPDRDAQTYSLLDTLKLTKLHLCLEKGFLVYVSAERFSQPLRSPVNGEVLIAQINELMDNLISLFDGKNLMTDKQREYYQRLKIEYLAAKEENGESGGGPTQKAEGSR